MEWNDFIQQRKSLLLSFMNEGLQSREITEVQATCCMRPVSTDSVYGFEIASVHRVGLKREKLFIPGSVDVKDKVSAKPRGQAYMDGTINEHDTLRLFNPERARESEIESILAHEIFSSIIVDHVIQQSGYDVNPITNDSVSLSGAIRGTAFVLTPEFRGSVRMLCALGLRYGYHLNLDTMGDKNEEQHKIDDRWFYIHSWARKVLERSIDAIHIRDIGRIDEMTLGRDQRSSSVRTGLTKIVQRHDCPKKLEVDLEADIARFSNQNPLGLRVLSAKLYRFADMDGPHHASVCLSMPLQSPAIGIGKVLFVGALGIMGYYEGSMVSAMDLATHASITMVERHFVQHQPFLKIGFEVRRMSAKCQSDDEAATTILSEISAQAVSYSTLSRALIQEHMDLHEYGAQRIPFHKIRASPTTEQIADTTVRAGQLIEVSRSAGAWFSFLDNRENRGSLQKHFEEMRNTAYTVSNTAGNVGHAYAMLVTAGLIVHAFYYPGRPWIARFLHLSLPTELGGMCLSSKVRLAQGYKGHISSGHLVELISKLQASLIPDAEEIMVNLSHYLAFGEVEGSSTMGTGVHHSLWRPFPDDLESARHVKRRAEVKTTLSERIQLILTTPLRSPPEEAQLKLLLAERGASQEALRLIFNALPVGLASTLKRHLLSIRTFHRNSRLDGDATTRLREHLGSIDHVINILSDIAAIVSKLAASPS